MSGITDLATLLANLRPTLIDGDFVFITRSKSNYGDGADLKPIAAFMEVEGWTLVVPKDSADTLGESYSSVFRMITLRVNSSLDAVGLTAAVAGKLAQQGISANVIAAFHHDHVFVPVDRAEEALASIEQLAVTTD